MSSTTEEYLLRAGAMMSTCERVNAAECHSIALFSKFISFRRCGRIFFVHGWAVKGPIFLPKTPPFDPPISTASRKQFEDLPKYERLPFIDTYFYILTSIDPHLRHRTAAHCHPVEEA